jgi:hypothetical protein
MTSDTSGNEEILSPAVAGSVHLLAGTPPSSSRKAGRTQTGLELCLPSGPLAGNEPGIFFRNKLGFVDMRFQNSGTTKSNYKDLTLRFYGAS